MIVEERSGGAWALLKHANLYTALQNLLGGPHLSARDQAASSSFPPRRFGSIRDELEQASFGVVSVSCQCQWDLR